MVLFWLLLLASLHERAAFVTYNSLSRSTTQDAVSITRSHKGPVSFPAGYNRIEIEYCTGCRWMLRAGWLAQELLTTFQEDIDEVAIQPALVSGTFDIRVNSHLVWSRKDEGRFPEAKEVKQKVRDIISPRRDLGHSDVAKIVTDANKLS